MRTVENIKTWAKVAAPNKTVWFFQFIFALIPSLCTILSSIPNAKAITSLIVFDYNSAIYYLSISFALTAVYVISWQIQYRLDSLQLSHIYPKLQKQIFSKVFSAEETFFNTSSKEKMINIISNNIAELSDFCDFSSIKFACFVEFIVLLFILLSNNYKIGLTILFAAIVIYLLMKFTNKMIAKKDIKLLDERDALSETFSDIVSNRIIGQDYNLKDNLEQKYMSNVNNIVKTYKSRTHFKSFKDNVLYLFYTTVVFVLTIYLASLVSLDQISLATYLVIIPYLTSAIDKIMCFCNISSDIENGTMNAMRVRSLLSMRPKELIEFGKNSEQDINGAITFSLVSYSSKDKSNKTLGTVNQFFAQILKNQTALFQGNKGCGKRAIFYMLRRAISPDTGTITLDTINIYDFSQKAYISNVSYVTGKPYFYTGTIEQNLKLINPSKRKIVEACKIAKIHDKIMSLPNTYQTSLQTEPNIFSNFEKYLLSIARAILTGSNVLLLYEFPTGITTEEQETIKNILKTLKRTKTIIIFSALNLFPELLDKHFIVENNKVSEQKTEKREKQKVEINSKFSK